MRVQDSPFRHFVQVAGTPCTHQGLEAGDVLLRHGEKQITKVSDMYGLTHERLDLSVIRAGTEIHVEVPTVTMTSYLVDRVVWFCGAQLETPYSPVHFYTQKIHSRVWISSVLPASPASMFDLPILQFVTRINNDLVEDLDSLVRAIELLPEDQYCQITCVNRAGVSRIVPIRPNMRDFKTSEVRRVVDSQEWQYREL